MPLTHAEAKALSPGALLVWPIFLTGLTELVLFHRYEFSSSGLHIRGFRLKPQYQADSKWGRNTPFEDQVRQVRADRTLFQATTLGFYPRNLAVLAPIRAVDILRRLL
jgi:hypothetical protein